MTAIKKLPPEVASRIAAGEVVERPASVVKELVENSIDAGARSIVVDVEEGGSRRIAVTDDGCGMDGEDATRACERFATSKIANEDDIFHLSTMGFRGEALNAIASVSDLAIETRVDGTLEGTRVDVVGGGTPSIRTTGCPRGTRIEVKELFHNTPARRKFLKSPSVEFGHINAELTRIALAHPKIHFELTHNGRRLWNCPPANELIDRAGLVASKDERTNLIELAEDGYGLRLTGWIGSDLLTRASAKDCNFFINRRPVRDRLLMHGLVAGFGHAIERGRFPVAALFLEMDPQAVDVNVHPAKREVRFENGAAVHDVVQAAVRKALDGSRGERAFGTVCHSRESGNPEASTPGSRLFGRDDNQQQRVPPFTREACLSVDTDLVPALRVLGQFDNTFIVCEGEGGELIVIDQHAAHERIGYDELMRQYREGTVERQQLLFPQTIALSSTELAAFDGAAEAIAHAGFDAEPFGGSEIVVKAMPALLGESDVKQLFEKMFAELASLGSSAAIDEKVGHLLSVIACHRQVRAGDRLGSQEMQSLVDSVVREKIDSCPHGRPAVIRFTRNEIDKWFKR